MKKLFIILFISIDFLYAQQEQESKSVKEAKEKMKKIGPSFENIKKELKNGYFTNQECKLLISSIVWNDKKRDVFLNAYYNVEHVTFEGDWYGDMRFTLPFYLYLFEKDKKWVITDFFQRFYGVGTVKQDGDNKKLDSSWVPTHALMRNEKIINDFVFNEIFFKWEKSNVKQAYEWVDLCSKKSKIIDFPVQNK